MYSKGQAGFRGVRKVRKKLLSSKTVKAARRISQFAVKRNSQAEKLKTQALCVVLLERDEALVVESLGLSYISTITSPAASLSSMRNV